jgi:hypothetical protein
MVAVFSPPPARSFSSCYLPHELQTHAIILLMVGVISTNHSKKAWRVVGAKKHQPQAEDENTLLTFGFN